MYKRRASLQEIKRFITKPSQSSAEELYGIDQVNDIRNALYMPNGFMSHVEVLNALCGISDDDMREEWVDYEDPENPRSGIKRIKKMHRINDDVVQALKSIDRSMQVVMRTAFEKNILGKSGTMYSQRSFPGDLKSGRPGAWPLFESLVSEAFDPDAESSVDVETYFNPTDSKGKKKSPPGKYDPVTARFSNPDFAGSYSEDIVDTIIDDMIEIVLDVEDHPESDSFVSTHDRLMDMMELLKEDEGSLDDPLTPDEANSLRIIMRKEIASAESKILARESERAARAPGVNFRKIIQAIKNTFEQFMSRFSGNTAAGDLPSKFVDLLAASVGVGSQLQSPAGKIASIDVVPESLDDSISNFVNEVHEALMDILYKNESLMKFYIPVIEDEQPIYDSMGNVTYEENGIVDQHFDENGKMYVTSWDEAASGR